MKQFSPAATVKRARAGRIAGALADAAALGIAWKLLLKAILSGGVLPLLQTFWIILFANAIWLYARIIPIIYRLARSPSRQMDRLPPGATRKILIKALGPEMRRALYPALTAGPTALAFLLFGMPPRRETAETGMALAAAVSGAALIAAAMAWALGALRSRSPRSTVDLAVAFLGPFSRKPLFASAAAAAGILPIYLFGKDQGSGPAMPLLSLQVLCLLVAGVSAARAFHFATLAYFEGKPQERNGRSPGRPVL